MKGSYTVKVHNKRVSFTIELERNITIISGNSATGKTTLVNSILFYEELGVKSGVSIESDKECRVLRGKNWYSDLQNISDSFVFIDEGNEFIVSKEFASAIQNTDNYYVFVTRENLHQLPYSVNSILQLKKTTSRFKHTYNRTYPVYDHFSNFLLPDSGIDVFITEDSNSGYEFFKHLADRNGIHCFSANGKSNLMNQIIGLKDTRNLVIVDGAAFGANMAEVFSFTKRHSDSIFLYIPESFEWLLLSSEIIHDGEIKDILSDPSQYIDSCKYFSWEQYFTALLEEKTKGTPAKYSKRRLSKYYLQEGNVNRVIDHIREK